MTPLLPQSLGPVATCMLAAWPMAAPARAQLPSGPLELRAEDGVAVFQRRPIPDGVVLEGRGEDAETYGYRIPSLLTTASGTVLAFAERRLGIHDHAQNDIVVKRSADGGRSFGEGIVVFEDGMHSINDPLTVALDDGRTLLMCARFPYGRHARDAGWIRMAEPGYDDPDVHVLTYLVESRDDGRTWSKPVDLTRQLKPPHWINCNSPGAMIQLRRGPHRGRIVATLWGTVPPPDGPGSGRRTWELLVAYSDDGGRIWRTTEPLEDPEDGYPNECQVAETANGDLVLVSRNQEGAALRKKARSSDGGATWTALATDPTLPSVACMGSLVTGPQRGGERRALYATHPSAQGRIDGRVSVSTDDGRSFTARAVVRGGFAYSACAISPDGEALLCLYETGGYDTIRMLRIPLDALHAGTAQRPNVLLLLCDDLNDWVGYLGGHPDAHTPNIDRVAARGLAFTRAYCVSPLCGPSRAALLTGMRPETTGVYTNQGTYVDHVPNAVVLPRCFKDNGYHVMAAGKVNHAMGCVVAANYHEYGPDAGAIGGPFTWEELNLDPGNPVDRPDIAGRSGDTVPDAIVENVYPGKRIRRGSREVSLPLNGIDNRIDRPENGYNTFDWGPVPVDDLAMPDGRMAAWAAERLAVEHDRPFFLAVGFYRPHQPWYAPDAYFEPFRDREVALPADPAGDLGDCPPVAHQYARFPGSGSFSTVLSSGQWQQAVQGYLASIRFADAQVGVVLDALDASPYRDDTWVILASDHGWHLGEKEHWGKNTAWEESLRVPLVVVPPRSWKRPAGRSDALVSLLDIYPTLAEACGLVAPADLEGRSLLPLVVGEATGVHDHVVSSVGRSTFAVRRGNDKLIRYYDGSEELYDLARDPHESRNLAGDPEQAVVLDELRALLPIDGRFRRFLRMGRYKSTVDADGVLRVYDMLHPRSGILEHVEVTATQPGIVERIRAGLEDRGDAGRHVLLPHREAPASDGG